MKKYMNFVGALAKIGCIGFGGGSALIPVIEDEIIHRQKLDTQENLDKDVIVASITPGALPVEIAASVGRRNFGSKGMILGATAMALPGTLMTIFLLTILYSVQERALQFIELASIGVSVFIIQLLLHYITGTLKVCRKESGVREKKAIFLMVVFFFLVCEKNIYAILGINSTPILGVSTFHALLFVFFCIFYSRSRYHIGNITVMFVLGMIYLLGHGKAGYMDNKLVLRITETIMVLLAIWGCWQDIREKGWKYTNNGKIILKDALIWIVVFLLFSLPAIIMHPDAIPFLQKGALSSLMSFGGGDAYLTIADGLFVEGGMISETQFYSQIVSLVNVLPGSILCKTLSGVGYCIGLNLTGSMMVAFAFAIAGFVCSISFSCGCFIIFYHLYNNLSSLYVFQMVGRWIRPAIAGLLLNIILSLINQSLRFSAQFGITSVLMLSVMAVLLGFNMFLKKKYRFSTFAILAVNIAVVLALTFVCG